MVYEKLNHHLIFIILSQLFLLVNRIVYGQYIPGPHVGSQAVLVNNKIYYIGGYNSNKGIATVSDNSDVFYYDFGAPLSSTGLLSWVDLENQVIIPFMLQHSANLGGANQDSIFVIGGIRVNNSTSLVYQIDTKTNTVDSPAIKGQAPPMRRDVNSIIHEGKIYAFCGRTLDTITTFLNNFDILNTITMTWETGSLVNAPSPRFSYTATLVNGVIYYIGGAKEQYQTIVYEQMSNIYLYDTVSSAWSLKIATAVGPLPQVRIGHTAVYYNGKIYVYGGRTEIFTAAQGTMALLDTTTLQWSIPLQFVNTNTPRIVNNIPKLVDHTATLINGDKHMFLAFGNVTDNIGKLFDNNYYYIFDLEKSQWFRYTSNGEGNPKSASTNTPTAVSPPVIIQQPLNTTVIIGLSAGLAVVGLGAIAEFIFIYKRHMKKKNQDEEFNDVGIPSESMKINQRSSTYNHTEVNDVGIPSESMKINQRSSTYNQTNHTEVNDVGIPSESMKINQRSSTYNQTNHTEVNDVGIPSESMKINQRSSTYNQTNHTEVNDVGIPSESMKINQRSSTYNQTNHTEVNDVGIPSESMKINQRSSTYNQTNHTEVNDVGIPSESMKINQRSSTYNQTNHTEVNDVGIPSESMKINQQSSTYSQTNHTAIKST